MKNLVAASLVLFLALGSTCFAEDGDLDGDWHSGTLNFSLGIAFYELELLGDTPSAVFPGAPDDWQVRGEDLYLNINGKAPSEGVIYTGGGFTFLLGIGDDKYEGTTLFESESYGHVGADLFVELGFRVPIGSAYHLDMGGRFGGTVDYYWGTGTAFSYTRGHLWAGPVVTFEPNGGLAGFFASGSVRVPIVGAFGFEDIGLDESFDVSGGYRVRIEAGFIFPNGIALAGFVEDGEFEYEDDDVDFDQDYSAIGVEIRLTK